MTIYISIKIKYSHFKLFSMKTYNKIMGELIILIVLTILLGVVIFVGGLVLDLFFGRTTDTGFLIIVSLVTSGVLVALIRIGMHFSKSKKKSHSLKKKGYQEKSNTHGLHL